MRGDDRPWAETLAHMDELIARGYVVFVKWTCPKCGDRCTMTEPNAMPTHGCVHEEREDGTPCGALYTGGEHGMYGLMAIAALGPSTGENLADMLRRMLSK